MKNTSWISQEQSSTTTNNFGSATIVTDPLHSQTIPTLPVLKSKEGEEDSKFSEE